MIPARLELGAFVLLQPRVPMTACAHLTDSLLAWDHWAGRVLECGDSR
jgi:hypothetical protein